MLDRHGGRLRDMAALVDGAPATVNHTDLNSGNAHIRASGQICLIDWDDAILSAPGWSLHMPFSGAHAVLHAARSLADTGARDLATVALRQYTRALSRTGLFEGTDFTKLLPAAAAFGVLKYATDMAPYTLAGTGMETNVASFAARRLKDLGEMLDGLDAEDAPSKPLAKGATTAFPEVQIKSRVATSKEIAKGAKLFRKNGALLIRDCVPRPLIAAVNAELEITWAKHEAEIAEGRALRVGSKRYMISLSTDGALGQAEVLAASRITAICEQVLGSDMILGSLTTVVSLPGSEAQRWHCDNSDLFPESPDLDTPAYSIAAIIPLIGLTADIGATQVQPKSHRRGTQIADDLPYAIPDPGPGDCYLMDSRLMHRGLPNQSNVKRPILSLVYQRPWYKDYQNFNQQDALTISKPVYDAFPADCQPLIKWAVPT